MGEEGGAEGGRALKKLNPFFKSSFFFPGKKKRPFSIFLCDMRIPKAIRLTVPVFFFLCGFVF